MFRDHRFAKVWILSALPLLAGMVVLNGGCTSRQETDESGSGGAPSAAGSPDEPASAGAPTGASDGGAAGQAAGGEGGGSPAQGLLIECDDRDVTDATEVRGGIADDATWQGKIHITGPTQVRAGKLTILPGTRILVDADATLDVYSPSGGATTLVAEGTADEPIRFCGREAERGYWKALNLASIRTDSVLRHVLVADAGQEDAALVIEKSIDVSDVVVRNSAKTGVRAAGFNAGSERLSAVDNGGLAMVLTAAPAVTSFPLGGTIVDNGDDTISLTFGGAPEGVVFHAAAVPYRQERTLSVGDVEVTFEAGVVYRMAADTSLDIGGTAAATELQVQGTADAPVVFEGDGATWKGLGIGPRVKTSSTLRYLILRGGGHAAPALSLGAPILLDHVELEDNEQGASFDAGVAEGSTELVITGTKGYPLKINGNHLHHLPSSGNLAGNDEDYVLVEGKGVSGLGCSLAVVEGPGAIADLGVPYRLKSCLELSDADVTVAPGATFIMEPGTQFQIAHSVFSAVGDAEHPITFKGLDETAGSWRGVLISSALPGSLLDHVEIGHGGMGTTAKANLTLDVASVVQNSKFFASAGFGISKKATDTTNYETSNTFEGVASGPVGTH